MYKKTHLYIKSDKFGNSAFFLPEVILLFVTFFLPNFGIFKKRMFALSPSTTIDPQTADSQFRPLMQAA